MADEESTQVSVEEKARNMGWKPKDEFPGDPEKWVEADEFVRRGEEVLPIVQASNRKLRESNEQMNARLIELERQNRANAAALEAIQEENRQQTVQTTERSIEVITVEIAAAREAGDVAREFQLIDERNDAKEALKAAKQKPQVKQTMQQPNGGADPAQTPEFQQFLKDNPWWQTDGVMRAASIEIQNQLYADGQITAATPQADRLAMVAEATLKKFGVKDNGRRQRASRVESGGGPGTGGSEGEAGKTYADLPTEAKAACDKAAKRLTFGEGKRYKDLAAWRASYAKTYYST